MTLSTVRMRSHQDTTAGKINSLAFGGIKTGLSLFTAAKILDIAIVNPSKTTKEALAFTNRLGKFGLIFSCILGFVIAGNSIYEYMNKN